MMEQGLQVMNVCGVDCYESNGVAWIRLEDVARGLGFVDSKGGKEYVRWATVKSYLKEIGFSQEVAKDSFVPENVFYRLAMKAKNETAVKFQDLVAYEILPTIRKNGFYMTEHLKDQIVNNPDILIAIGTKIKEEQERNRKLMEENKSLRANNEQMLPKALFADAVSVTKSEITVGELSKLVRQNGVEIGRTRMFQVLRAKGFLIHEKGKDWNLPTQRSMELGLFRVKESTIHANGEVILSRTPYVTGKGITYFMDKFLSGALRA